MTQRSEEQVVSGLLNAPVEKPSNGQGRKVVSGVDIGLITAIEAPLDVVVVMDEDEDIIVHCRFKPNIYSQKFMEENDDKTIGQTLPLIITDWDLIYSPDPENPDHKEKVPITEEGFAMLPTVIVNAMWSDMMDALRPNRRRTQSDSTDGGSFM